MRHYTEQQVRNAIEFKLWGMNQKKAAKQIGVSRQALSQALIDGRLTAAMAAWAGFDELPRERLFVRRGK
jgi:DNA transposition AAA+ family ATPase